MSSHHLFTRCLPASFPVGPTFQVVNVVVEFQRLAGFRPLQCAVVVGEKDLDGLFHLVVGLRANLSSTPKDRHANTSYRRTQTIGWGDAERFAVIAQVYLDELGVQAGSKAALEST
jgi:hypothetical protein